ncbi:hypothetical protein, partial [Parvimonas micra]
ILPDKTVIGDPFWILMEIDQNTKKNTGNYFIKNNLILLFTSKKIAEKYCEKQSGCSVFGVSQSHLSFILSLVEQKLCPYNLGVFIPKSQTSESINDKGIEHVINYGVIREIYLR